MNKKELLEHIQKIYDKVDELETTAIKISDAADEMKAEARGVLNMLEEIPDNPSEIEEDTEVE